MNKELIQGTPEWLEMRRHMVMASDSPIIMGVSPWKTPLQLYWEKVEGTQTVKTSAMERGLNLEDEARQLFEKLTGNFVHPKVLIDQKDPWLGASLDGYNEDGIVVEIKCPNRDDHEEALGGGVPPKYFPQLQHQMWVARVSEMYYFSYNPDHEDKWALVTVIRAPYYLKSWYEKVHSFYECLITKTPPRFNEVEKLKNEIKDSKYIDSSLSGTEERLASLLEDIQSMEQEAEILRKQLIEYCDGSPAIGSFLKFTPIASKGRVDYTAIPCLKGVDLEPYRKPAKVSWRVDFL